VSLTSLSLRALTIVLAILATAATMLLWNRVAGPRVTRAASRLGLLLASYTFTMIAVLVSINIAYGGLISSWGGLFDNLRPGPLHAVDRGGSPHAAGGGGSPHAAGGGAMTPGWGSTAPLARPGHDQSRSFNEPRRTARPR